MVAWLAYSRTALLAMNLGEACAPAPWPAWFCSPLGSRVEGLVVIDHAGQHAAEGDGFVETGNPAAGFSGGEVGLVGFGAANGLVEGNDFGLGWRRCACAWSTACFLGAVQLSGARQKQQNDGCAGWQSSKQPFSVAPEVAQHAHTQKHTISGQSFMNRSFMAHLVVAPGGLAGQLLLEFPSRGLARLCDTTQLCL